MKLNFLQILAVAAQVVSEVGPALLNLATGQVASVPTFTVGIGGGKKLQFAGLQISEVA